MSAVKMKIPEDNITTYLTMRSHFKKIYDVRPRVNCWSEACPSKRLLKNTINIRDFQVLPHYCNSTISSAAKKSKQQKYDNNKLSRSPPSKKKSMNRNLSYECPYNDDDFGFGSVENNNRTYYTPETHHPHLAENTHKTIRSQQHNPLHSDHPKETTKKKNKFFQNTMNESYQRFLEEMTNEVVRLDLSTDKALKNVFRKHIKHNIGKLDEKKMVAEVMKVQALLDLPMDNDDRYSGIDDMPTLSANDATNQHNLPAALKSEK
ncbi:uncharacterized protein LOC113558872 isoform X1 [Rhopalosiphum maidis]|uniref:uncharacterized protein LOC113558872 isoform X1 n=2 Tax=Rhopalosiphum maidis TaxID=43146 RepID=UPI000EFF1EFF|nr:uncharacterized protein LOC113558872 isoform X1 [Rhopalosiphum maidis]